MLGFILDTAGASGQGKSIKERGVAESRNTVRKGCGRKRPRFSMRAGFSRVRSWDTGTPRSVWCFRQRR